MSGTTPTSSQDGSVLVEGSSSRRALLESFRGAEASRLRALLRDPGLAARGESDGNFSDREVAQVAASIANARRLRDAESAYRGRSRERLSALVLALALVLVFLRPAGVERSLDSFGSAAAGGVGTITHPGVEAIAPAGVRVYELAEEEFSVVWFIDESFEL